MMLTRAFSWLSAAAHWRTPNATEAHQRLLSVLRTLDQHPDLCREIGRRTFPVAPVMVGGVLLPHPLILSAGIVKDEWLSGWRSLPLLVGAVEFGSFTLNPHRGNSGETLEFSGANVYNRVGLNNYGVEAVAQLIKMRSDLLHKLWGISLAPSPGARTAAEAAASLMLCLNALEHYQTKPRWITFNLSCPNTDIVYSTADLLRLLPNFEGDVPVWIKVPPDLTPTQYRDLLELAVERNVRAIIAVNAQRVLHKGNWWGMSGRNLFMQNYLASITLMNDVRISHHYKIDIIASGGIMTGFDWKTLTNEGIRVGMYLSAIYTRGLLAGALILDEASRER